MNTVLMLKNGTGPFDCRRNQLLKLPVFLPWLADRGGRQIIFAAGNNLARHDRTRRKAFRR